MLIGKLAATSGFSRDTIRYYEKLGLLGEKELERQENRYKNYPPQALERLLQVRQLKGLGFTLNEIACLFEGLDSTPQPCAALPAQLDDKVALLDEKLALLKVYRSKLQAVRQACDGNCKAPRGLPDCFEVQCR